MEQSGDLLLAITWGTKIYSCKVPENSRNFNLLVKNNQVAFASLTTMFTFP